MRASGTICDRQVGQICREQSKERESRFRDKSGCWTDGRSEAVARADINHTIVAAGGSITGAGIDDKSRALERSVEILQQLAARVSLFAGQVVEQQFSGTA